MDRKLSIPSEYSTRSRNRRAVVGLVISLVAFFLMIPPAAATPILSNPLPMPLDPAQVTNSMVYLKNTYGVNDQEALRRLELQKFGDWLDGQLVEQLPDEYAGLWMDQSSGGKLIVASTNPTRMTSMMRGLEQREHIRTVAVQYSLQELRSIRDQLATEIPNEQGSIAIDVVDNVVAVYQRPGAAEAGKRVGADLRALERQQNIKPAEVDATIARLLSWYQGKVVVRQLILGEERTGTALLVDAPVGPACDPRRCGPPMRGGMRLDVLRNQPQNNPNYVEREWGQCTNGFNVRDWRRPGWWGIMTAGHCFTGPGKVGTTFTHSRNNGGRNVSTEDFRMENGPTTSGGSTYPLDYAIAPYTTADDATYWLTPYPGNWVASWCWSSSQPCTDGAFGIRSVKNYDAIRRGWVVCATGTGDSGPGGYKSNSGYNPGTRCGTVLGKDGGIAADICSRPGDSGGPLFSEVDSSAYGILWGGTTDVSGACRAGEYSQYSAVSNILPEVRAQSNRPGLDLIVG